MRDKDANSAWPAASDATLDERWCWWQNAGGGRADVGVLAPGAGQLSVTRGNRIGYAGYRFDSATERYQGRDRVYAPVDRGSGSATPSVWKIHFGLDRGCRSQSLAPPPAIGVQPYRLRGRGECALSQARRIGVVGATKTRLKVAETQRLESRCHARWGVVAIAAMSAFGVR